nr:EOG090X0DYO [Polyphemus pediculus]
MAALLKTIRLQRVFSLSINLLKSQDIAVNQVRYFKAKWVKPTLFELKRRKDIEDDRNGGPKIFHRSTFLDWNYDAELYAFKNRIEEQIDDVLLRTALTHKSYIEEEANKLRKLGIEPNLKLKDNGDLAARGEILLSRYIYGYLRAVFTRVPEEMINAMHNHLMGNDVLAHVAKHIGMGDIILCADFPCADDTSAKSFQAIVASIEESCGEERARIFVQDLVLTQSCFYTSARRDDQRHAQSFNGQ